MSSDAPPVPSSTGTMSAVGAVVRRIDLKRNASSESLLRGRGFKQLRLNADDSLPPTPDVEESGAAVVDAEMVDIDRHRGPYFEQLPRRLVIATTTTTDVTQTPTNPPTGASAEVEMETACRTGDEDRIRYLLERCSLDPNMPLPPTTKPKVTYGTSPYAAPPRWSPLLTACRYKQSGAARVLLAYGANPNVRSGTSTPFRELLNGLWLRNLPDESMVLDLLDAGADPLDGLYRHSTRFSDVLADYPEMYATALPRLLEIEHLSAQKRGWTTTTMS